MIQRECSHVFSAYNILQLDTYKIVRAHTAVLHVNKQFEIDYIKFKTVLSFKQIITENISLTFEEMIIFVASDPCTFQICSPMSVGPVHFPGTYEVYGAEQTHFKLDMRYCYLY